MPTSPYFTYNIRVSKVEKKLAELPKSPGVYFYRDKAGEIIYVGKAAVLKNRVRQYFQASRTRDAKTDALVAEIRDIDWMEVDSELDALFLEAEMIRRYMPRYNILLRDDKSMVYVRIDIDSDYPTVTTTRRPLDDRAQYFGPYLSALSVRQALKLLRRVFPFATQHSATQKRANLYFHLGLDPGLEEQKTSLEDYRANLRKLIAVIKGRRQAIERELEKEMKRAAKNQDFERAATYRNQLTALRSLHKQIIFSDKEFLDISKDHALNDLSELLGLKVFPRRIEGYDISHMQGSNVVASMVVFSNGVSNKTEYRKFKTYINQNNDFANMNETIARRFSERNRVKWGLPNLVLIDGGKGQLEAALKARDAAGAHAVPFIGLAKREEQLVVSNQNSGVKLNQQTIHRLGGFVSSSDDFTLVNLPHTTNIVKLLQRIRDESHRFAVSYHSVLKNKQQTASILDGIPGVGPVSRKQLIKSFGSGRGVRESSLEDLQKVIGAKKAKVIFEWLKAA